ENVLYIHVTLVPYLSTAGELKTKPTQHSVKELRSIGIKPDVLICRTEVPLSEEIKSKIALFCDLHPSEVIENIDVDTIYELPLVLEKEGLAQLVIDKLNLKCDKLDLTEWKSMVEKIKNLKEKVTVALVGKYVELKDAYLSVSEALTHGGIYNDVHVDIKWIHSEDINEENVDDLLCNVDGILVPGGFGSRGIEGKITAIKYARENKIPFFGICLGMQMAVVEFARNVLGLKGAHSAEFDPDTDHPVIDLMPEQRDVEALGGTMRLGVYPCKLKDDSFARKIYGLPLIYERHRHRYEFNNKYREQFENSGMVISGISPDERLVELIELKDHPWFIATQFHPEFKSRPTKAHPLFKSFIAACKENKKKDN
ncbi:MAG: CTP synthase, partial [Tissierellales bacterium]